MAQSPVIVAAMVYLKSSAHTHVVARHSMRRQSERLLLTEGWTWLFPPDQELCILLPSAGPVETL